MRMLVFVGVAAAVLTPSTPARADVKAGVDAWARGDYPAAITQWRGPAIAGDADAQFNMGQAYKLGRGVPVDPAQAESWFRKAAMQGHPLAEDNYGLALFQAGRKADALPWLEKSVARGEPRGELVLGTMLFNGDGVTKDWPRAYALMTRASAAGLQSASQTLAQMDQYITPEDRERGTALAAHYAARAEAMPPAPPRRPTEIPASGAARTPIDRGRPAPEKKPHAAPPAPSTATGKPAPVTKPAPSQAGGWRVQLGAFGTEANAQAQWAKLRTHLSGASPFYVKAGAVTRLLAGPFGSKADAAKACKAVGTACLIVAP